MASVSQLRDLTIGVVPGTGLMGSALAKQYSRAGLKVWIGSRDAAKAKALAEELRVQDSGSGPKLDVEGGTNQEAAAQADVVFWCIMGPLEERHLTLRGLQEELRNKIIIDITNIGYLIDEKDWGQVSSTLYNIEALGVPAKWTCAWKATDSKMLKEPPTTPFCTFVCGDDPQAVAITMQLVELIHPFKAINAGGLKNTRIVELLGPLFYDELDRLNCGGQDLGGWQFGV